MPFSNLFVKKVVQDLTSGGIDWQREKWQSGLGSKFIHQGEKNAAKYADEVIVLSKGVQDYFKETYGRKTHFIPNGVNRPQIREAKLISEQFGLEKDSYILFLGRLVPEKGIRYLVEAFKNIKTDKKLVIAGGSSDTDSFMEELKELAKGDDRILFTGFVQGAMLDELYSNAYIYTLPSDLEGKAELTESLNGKTILLIAPGKSSIEEKDGIISFVNEDVVTVSVNYNYPLVDTDYIFLSNLRRFRELDGDFLKSTNKKCFRQAHAEDITKYEEARQFLKQDFLDEKFPLMKDLRDEKELLMRTKDARYETYVLVGDYYLPALKLPRTRPIGRWGMLYKAYLKLRKPAYYQSLLLSGKLDTVLADVEEQAAERYEVLIEQMSQREGVSEKLKEENQMEWVRRMSNLENRAAEIVKTELIYTYERR